MNEVVNFLFNSTPQDSEPAVKIYLSIALGLLLLIIFILTPHCKKYCSNKAFYKTFCRKRGAYLGLGLGILFFTWLRTEKVPVLSMQIWWVLLILAIIILLIWRLRKFLILNKRIKSAKARRLAVKKE